MLVHSKDRLRPTANLSLSPMSSFLKRERPPQLRGRESLIGQGQRARQHRTTHKTRAAHFSTPQGPKNNKHPRSNSKSFPGRSFPGDRFLAKASRLLRQRRICLPGPHPDVLFLPMLLLWLLACWCWLFCHRCTVPVSMKQTNAGKNNNNKHTRR
ncbi:hypothetical protein B0J11DRAFT_518808 [Dendryphion nanum]|uniref:Uncharacterized protein n=1 Tax=Dendryphion nanum TaxID=256645 RepID=A0A9P9IX98_9PLEO|nr:hypothetical protein B0J11DRAFT_518808 [Dendryphion nanum]